METNKISNQSVLVHLSYSSQLIPLDKAAQDCLLNHTHTQQQNKHQEQTRKVCSDSITFVIKFKEQRSSVQIKSTESNEVYKA
jgi:uncharacterized membrane-anchored protein YhcB (DUF1043 family)